VVTHYNHLRIFKKHTVQGPLVRVAGNSIERRFKL